MRRALAALAALAFAGCSGASSSLYPSAPAAALLPGSMSVSVEAAAPFDFSGSQYNVIFNTSGSGKTPHARVSDFAAYSYGLIAGGDGNATAGPVAFLRAPNPHVPPSILALRATPAQFTFNPNSNGLGTEYQVTFARNVFGSRTLPAVKNVWTFDVAVSKSNLRNAHLQFVSGLGSCAGCFTSPKLDVSKRFDAVKYVTVRTPSVDPSQQILRVEIVNNP